MQASKHEKVYTRSILEKNNTPTLARRRRHSLAKRILVAQISNKQKELKQHYSTADSKFK
jgi:hypothetical protein